jgi:hypothetical protein
MLQSLEIASTIFTKRTDISREDFNFFFGCLKYVMLVSEVRTNSFFCRRSLELNATNLFIQFAQEQQETFRVFFEVFDQMQPILEIYETTDKLLLTEISNPEMGILHYKTIRIGVLGLLDICIDAMKTFTGPHDNKYILSSFLAFTNTLVDGEIEKWSDKSENVLNMVRVSLLQLRYQILSDKQLKDFHFTKELLRATRMNAE